MKIDILAVGVHPDDVELSCSGTLLKHIELGKTVGLLDLTQGELGTRGNAALRHQEAQTAAALMGAKFRLNLGMADGFFSHTPENIKRIVQVIRTCQPDIVLANAIDDRHPDHGRAAKLTADACFYAGLSKIETSDEQGLSQMRWRPQAVYHYIQDKHLEPDFVIDITPFMERKMALILSFKSQFYDPTAANKDLATPISGKSFMDFMYAKNRVFARPIGSEFAEGFIASRTIGVDNLFNLR